eukprot:Pgem_evm1s14392
MYLIQEHVLRDNSIRDFARNAYKNAVKLTSVGYDHSGRAISTVGSQAIGDFVKSCEE